MRNFSIPMELMFPEFFHFFDQNSRVPCSLSKIIVSVGINGKEEVVKHVFQSMKLVVLPILFDLGSVAARPITGVSGGTDTLAYTIDNCIRKFSEADIEKTAAGYQYWFVDPAFADGKTLKLSVVAPHLATHPPHIHTENEFFFILEGNAEVFFQGKWTAIGPFTSFYCPSNIEHGIRNAGDNVLKYLVIKQYGKTNPVRVEYEQKHRNTQQR
jgi:mannose-6-phosphate isomerase-like protein (cupin superfamily)